MERTKWKRSYSLSQRDLIVMGQAKVSLSEVVGQTQIARHLPPLWSTMSYVMLFYPEKPPAAFWKKYRELIDLANHREKFYDKAYRPKRTSGTRTLLVPKYEIRRHQKFILKEILQRLCVSENTCSYRKGRGIKDLAGPHAGHDILVHLDIKDFFGSITESLVFETLLRETGYTKNVVGLITKLCCYKGRLPQGTCTSPYLSNLCFKQCDHEIAFYCIQKGLTYTRYSDDLFVSGNYMNIKQLIREVSAILLRSGFRINKDKTKVLRKYQSQRVTAVVVNEKPQITREYRRNLRQELYYVRKFKNKCKGALETGSYGDYLHELQGKIAFVLYIDPCNQEFIEARKLVKRLIRESWMDDPPCWVYH